MRLRLLMPGIALIACSHGTARPSDNTPRTILRAPMDLPTQFALSRTTRSSTDVGIVTCRNPLFDPRDASQLRLIRSSQGNGDYEVEGHHYSIRDGELLRIDCKTLQGIGIVRR